MATRSLNEDVRSLAFGSISSSYADVGSPTSHPLWQITVNNTTDVLMIVSKDGGGTDWIRIPPATSGIWEYTLKTERGDKADIPLGIQFQVKDAGDAATEGEVSISTEYLKS